MSETTPTPAPAPAPAPEHARTPLLPVILVLGGAYLMWFGVHYWRSDVKWPTEPVRDVLTGKQLPDNTRTDAVAPTTIFSQTSNDVASAVTASVISQKALQYKGAGYVWGGNASSIGDWDCSSFVSKVLGQDCNLPLPGGRWGDPGFPPHAHGPTTLDYMLYGTGVDHSQVRAGDLVVSVEHIGIAISPTQMISARDPAAGTGIGDFPAGFPAGPPIYRRPPAL